VVGKIHRFENLHIHASAVGLQYRRSAPTVTLLITRRAVSGAGPECGDRTLASTSWTWALHRDRIATSFALWRTSSRSPLVCGPRVLGLITIAEIR
jgi:hypothetical protein